MGVLATLGLRVDSPCAGCGHRNLWRSAHGPTCVWNAMWRQVVTDNHEQFIQAEIAKKRERVGMASTILDPLPSTMTSDTSVILSALDGASDLLQNLMSVTGLSPNGDMVLRQCRRAADIVRTRIREEGEGG